MASSTLTANPAQLAMDRMELDAARALLGVSPSLPVAEAPCSSSRPREKPHVRFSIPKEEKPSRVTHGFTSPEARTKDSQVVHSNTAVSFKRPRSDSAGLDALAALATKESSVDITSPLAPFLVKGPHPPSSSSSSDASDSEGMPPPPPRRRRRSASNPEGMEKWDSLASGPKASGRRHFVLPASILEEELEAVSAVVKQQESNREQQLKQDAEQVLPGGSGTEEEEILTSEKSNSAVDIDSEKATTAPVEGEVVDDANLTPDELLKRARSRLLEDLSEGSVNGEKGVLTLPHSLAKYKDVYNQNGRIGIYTPAERAAIIAKFNRKRTRRVWNKRIRYNCRKSLADRRLRVKGRFVKRSEQEQLAKELAAAAKQEAPEAKKSASKDGRTEQSEKVDSDMPDVNDPEAGFAPTEDQPYRRLRRHTIT